MKAYQEMMYGEEKHIPATKAKWAGLLQQYCRLDTLSMVLIYECWRRVSGLVGSRCSPSHSVGSSSPGGSSSSLGGSSLAVVVRVP